MNPEIIQTRAHQLLDLHPVPGASTQGLTELLQRATPLRVVDGAELCREGEAGVAMYLLVEGRVRVTSADVRGQPRLLAVQEAPALVGHMALIDGSPRSATCTADGEVRALVVEKSTYHALLGERSPAGMTLRRLLLSSLVRQLSGANHELRQAVAGVPLDEEVIPVTVEDAPVHRAPPPVAAPSARESVEQPTAFGYLTEEDLLEVSSVLEGWKRGGLGPARR